MQPEVGAREARPRAPRFVLTRPTNNKPSYCWRSTWNTGFDSAFSLLCKFGLLNGLTARELAQLFLSTRRGQRSKLIQRLHIDLRAAEFFSFDRIAQLLNLRSDTVGRAFVISAHNQQSVAESSRHLRYCRTCLRRGLHVAAFQFLFVQRCPLHGERLVEACERCGGLQPYELAAAILKDPFRCMHCRHDFAPRLRHPKIVCDLRLSAAERGRLADAIHIAESKSHLFDSAQQLERHFSFFGLDAVALSAPTLDRSRREYYAFIDALVRQLEAPQLVTKVDCSGASPDLIELRRGTAREEHILRFGPRSSTGCASRKVAERSADASAPSAEFTWDEKLCCLLPTYKAIRHRLWRELREHRICVISAARHLWWDVEGDTLEHFCPMAEAFLRWRMFWEGFSVPADLYQRPRHIAFGVQAWLSGAAPICPSGWSAASERWVAHRVFAMDCLRHYRTWQMHCSSRHRRKRHRWSRTEGVNGAMTYWLVAGSGATTPSVRLYLDNRPPCSVPLRSVDGGRSAHRRWHQDQIRQIRR